MLEVLLWAFVVDYVSGVAASIKSGKGLKSSIGFLGLCKKGLMLLIVLLAHRIDAAMDLNYVMNGTICFWLANEGVSITENYGRFGLKIPAVFKKIFAIFQEQSGSSEKNEYENK
ncbi:Holin family protein [compost metagenome]